MMQSTILDPQTLDTLREIAISDGCCLLTQMIDDFLIESETMLHGFRQAVAQRNTANICFETHRLRSSVLNFGQSNLANLCKTLERSAYVGEIGNIDKQVQRIEAEYLIFRAALAVERDK